MKKVIYAIVISLTAISSLGLLAETDTAAVTVKERDSQTVLYTLYRGDYSAMGQAIGKLYALAGQKGIIPAGAMSFVYLNNPSLVDKNHWLTEIRIVVNKDALKYAGTLGEMTDIKTLPPLEYAVITKPKGTVDPSESFMKLTRWVFENGYLALEGFSEQMPANQQYLSYDQMESKIMLPVKKTPQNN